MDESSFVRVCKEPFKASVPQVNEPSFVRVSKLYTHEIFSKTKENIPTNMVIYTSNKKIMHRTWSIASA